MVNTGHKLFFSFSKEEARLYCFLLFEVKGWTKKEMKVDLKLKKEKTNFRKRKNVFFCMFKMWRIGGWEIVSAIIILETFIFGTRAARSTWNKNREKWIKEFEQVDNKATSKKK